MLNGNHFQPQAEEYGCFSQFVFRWLTNQMLKLFHLSCELFFLMKRPRPEEEMAVLDECQKELESESRELSYGRAHKSCSNCGIIKRIKLNITRITMIGIGTRKVTLSSQTHSQMLYLVWTYGVSE